MKYLTLLLLLVIVNTAYSQTDSLTIEGNNIWIRSTPITGKVVFTLNEGSVCQLLEKGEKQCIGEATDYWYHISYQNKKGWVFGSQTSMKQKSSLPQFQTYLKNTLETHYLGQEFDKYILQSKAKGLKHDQIDYFRLYNAGSVCELSFNSLKNHSSKKEPLMAGTKYMKNKMPIDGFCKESKSTDGIYFKEVKEFPSYVIFSGEYRKKPIELPTTYKRGKKMKVVILYEHYIIKTLYFIAADNKWHLVVIDDCSCDA